MLKNDLKIAFRSLKSNGLYSLINILGLAIGLAVSMLILLYVLHEFSFDRFHTKGDRIHRLRAKVQFGEQEINTLAMSAGVGVIATNQLPEVAQAVRTQQLEKAVLQNEQRQISATQQILLADPNFLEVFSFDLLAGDAQLALQHPLTLVITPKIAAQYFGTENPIGQTLKYKENLDFTITGIVAAAPSNSTIQYDLIASMSSLNAIERMGAAETDSVSLSLNYQQMGLGSFTTYLLLAPEAKAAAIPEKMLALKAAEEDAPTSNLQFYLDALPDLHLKSFYGTGTSQIYLFLGIALLILGLALINYISLATARAIKRSKEVMIRKVIGASRKKLITQFYVESMVVILLAFAIGLGLVFLFQDYFYHLLELSIDQQFLYRPIVLSVYGILLVLSILLSGSLPAFMLSAFQPVHVLKGKLKRGKGGNRLRQSLTVFQFTAALVLMICSVVIYQQLQHFKTNAPDFAKEQILCVPFREGLTGVFQAYKTDLANQAGIEHLAVATSSIFRRGVNAFFLKSPFNDKQLTLHHINVDQNFLELFQLEWATAPSTEEAIGREGTIILNEQARKEFGKSDLLGEQIPLGQDGTTVIGVLKDFHYQSLEAPLSPLAIKVIEKSDAFGLFGGSFYLKFKPQQDLSQQIKTLRSIHQKFMHGETFEYYFLDEIFDNYYHTETRLGYMMTAFTAFAILIACLGLLGLITYATQSRTKEIGIRKVLGASVNSIIRLFSKDFIQLVSIAMVIASLIAWYFMQQWLQNFSFRTDLKWWVFASSGLFVLLLSLLTVSIQSARVAYLNPVKSLRDE
ncbi:MAG: ABC transporter permease [Bacteroidota bacterium]